MSLRILVTGAAGLIGGEVAGRLAARGHRVTALVHRNADVRDNRGRPVPLDAAVRGDVSLPRFGWSEAEHARVAGATDLVLHCAAATRFDLPLEQHRAINVAGTAHAVELARAGGAALLHVGTAYAHGARDGLVREDDPLPASGFANGYEASKAEAEALVAASGVRHAIARPSIVVGEYGDGAIRCFDTIYAAFKLIAEGRVRRMPARGDATLDFVPIDHVAAGLVALAERLAGGEGGRFHLVSGAPVPVADFAAAIGSYPQFSAPALIEPALFDAAALPSVERRLYGRVAGLYASYFQRAPRFDDAAFRAATGLACPPTDFAFLRRLIDHAISVGFLK